MKLVRTLHGVVGLATEAPGIALCTLPDDANKLAYDHIANRQDHLPRTVTLPTENELDAFNLGLKVGLQAVISKE